MTRRARVTRDKYLESANRCEREHEIGFGFARKVAFFSDRREAAVNRALNRAPSIRSARATRDARVELLLRRRRDGAHSLQR
jgi:hypothetical protein